MSLSRLAQLLQEALKKTVNRYERKKEQLEPVLLTFEKHQSLSDFLQEIYQHELEYGILKDDVKDLLEELGKNNQFTREIGKDFFLLWLESEIMDFGKFKQKRLGIKELSDFPLTRPEQLSFLESIFTAYSPSINKSEIDTNFLRKIQTQSLFNQFLKIQKTSKEHPVNSSKLMKQSQVREISQLRGFDKAKFTFTLLRKMVDIIGKVSDIKDPRQQLQKIQEYINDLLDKDSPESELLQDLQQVVLNILNIDIKKNCCIVKEKSQDAIMDSFKVFFKFYETLCALKELEQKTRSVDDFLKNFQKIVKDNRTAWLWPTCNQSSLIMTLRDICIQNSNDILQLNELLQKYSPNIEWTIWTFQKREFLFESLFRTPSTIEKGTYVKVLLKIARKQQLDIQKHFSGGKSYYGLFLDLGIPMKMLQKMESFIDKEHDCFMIHDKASNKKSFIFLSREHMTELLEKISNKQIQKGTIDSGLYHFAYQITDKTIEGYYKGFQQNTYCYGKIYQGPLVYSDITQFGDKVKDFSWKIIVSKTRNIIELSPEESQTIGSKIFRIIKNKDDNQRITCKIGQNQDLFQINVNTLEVYHLSQLSNFNSSKIKQNIGHLLFIPKFKGKKEEYIEIEEFEEVAAYPDLDYPLDVKNPPTKATPKFQSQYESESQEIFNRSKKTFPFLGFFKEFFDLQSNVVIDSKKNVLVSYQDRKTLDYFQRFQQEAIFRLMDSFLLPSIPLKRHFNFNPSIPTIFELSPKGKILADKKFDTLSKKYFNKKVINKYDSKKNQIDVQNMKNNKEAHNFFQAFFSYVTLLSKQESEKKSFILKVNKEQARYIQQSRMPGVTIKGKRDSRIQIEASPQMKEKLQKEIQYLEEVRQFLLDNYQAFEMMKSQENEYLVQKNVVEGQKMESIFKISLKLKYYPQFMNKYHHYCEIIAQKPGQTRQLVLSNESDFHHIYQAEFAKEDPQISVTKMTPDILIQYNSKIEKRVLAIIKRAEEQKQKQRDSISQKSSKEFLVKGINVAILFKLKNKLQKTINTLAKNNIQARINLDQQSADEFLISASQVNREQEELLPTLIAAFEKSHKAYKRIRYEINDTQKYFNQSFAKLPNPGKKSRMKKYSFDFKVKLRAIVLQIVQSTTQKYLKELQTQFQAFLDNKNLDIIFDSDLSQKNGKQIEEKTEKMNVFTQFLNDKIDEAEKTSKVKNAALRGLIVQETQQIVKTAQSAFNNSKLTFSIFRRFFKSVKILLTIYYGPQLPITSHLQEMRKKLQNSDVVMVKVGTGSGKSTVIPPYLVGLGYKKVVVTQPRRLPCRQIYKRITQVFGEGVAGYHVGDGFQDIENSLVYMTDGLIKMQAIYNEAIFDTIDVLVIDEIHERSANIDMLLLLLYRYFRQQKRKLKLILCSATIDTRIGDIIKEANLKVDIFEPQIPKKYKVTEHPIEKGTILQKIVELSKKMKNDEQLLTFFPGVADVNNGVSTLIETYNVQAFAITANQPHKIQEDIIQNGKIFISTALAETSLTFRNLKYVIDSRLSRWRSFDPDFEMMRTDEDYSSNSSIQQRKGRVGRNCDGQYYYFVYQDYDFKGNRQHNPTELQKNDFTNYIFEMMLKGQSRFQEVQALFRKLKHSNAAEFDKKMRHSEDILYDNNILQKNGTLSRNAMKFLQYGNLGNPQHNIALYEASSNGCFLNMAYLVAFQMFGVVALDSFLKFCKHQYKAGGDLRAIHDFLVFIGDKIDIANIKEKQVYNQMKIQHKSLMSHGWFNLLVKIMVKVCQLIKRNQNNVPAPVSQWDDMLAIFRTCYSNKVFFNQSLFGGNKKQYQKIRMNEEFNFDEKKIDNSEESKVSFILNKDSLVSQSNPGVILSLYCSISPLSQSVLSLCEAIEVNSVNLDLKIALKGEECDETFFKDGTKLVDQRKAFDDIHFDIRSNKRRVAQKYNFPEMVITGSFRDLVDSFQNVIQPKRKNDDVTIELKKILNSEADNYAARMQHAMTPIILKERSLILFQKLTHEDYKQLFNSIVSDFKANYGVTIRWDDKQGTFNVEKAKNIVLSKIIQKLTSFMSWFSQCQLLSREQYKIKPQYVGDFKNVKPEILDRINNIVNNRIEHYILKAWCSGRGPGTKEPRTARMIAVCWVLVNKFDCIIKGGFVRDWVVNGEEVLPKTNQQRVNLLQKNPKNRFLEVIDDTVTPSDIDVQLSPDTPFIEGLFLKEMKKLGISVRIQEDGWRKHIMFDHKTTSGGFTADLIQPFTSMTHYTYDFDVNVMYLKKNRLSSIGMKIPLEYEYSDKPDQKKENITLSKLLDNCMNKKMTALKNFIPKYRFDKFVLRKWTITSNPNMQPVCYKSLETQSFPVDPKEINNISPIFYEKMVKGKNCKIIRIESLKNKGWDDAFAATQHWIITELESQARKNNKSIHNINSNNKQLFHGTRDQNSANSIKNSGFDSRYFAKGGYYGRGAYFAEDPVKSHDYTGPPNRKMFIANVALGKQEHLTKADNNRTGPSVGYHSILGTAGSAKEYIQDRIGQAKLLYLITYQG